MQCTEATSILQCVAQACEKFSCVARNTELKAADKRIMSTEFVSFIGESHTVQKLFKPPRGHRKYLIDRP